MIGLLSRGRSRRRGRRQERDDIGADLSRAETGFMLLQFVVVGPLIAPAHRR
jgi:hypothetical protein